MLKYLDIIIKSVWLAVCLVGNMYQVSVIMELYFAYDTITTVDVSFPNFLKAPALDLCFPKVDLINWTIMNDLYPDIKDKLNLTDLSAEELSQHFAATGYSSKVVPDGIVFEGMNDSQIFDLLYDFDDLLGGCRVIDNDEMKIHYAECRKVYEIDPYISEMKLCFAMHQKINMTYDYLRISRLLTIPNFLYQVTFSPLLINSTESFLLIYNENNQISRDGYYRFIFLSNLEQLFTVTYEEYQSILLPMPYKSDCMNFRKFWKEEWVVDPGTCFESCMLRNIKLDLRQSMKFPGQLGFLNNSNKKDNPKFFTASQTLNDIKLFNMSRNISAHCDKVCSSPACDETIYIPKLQTALEYPFGAMITYVLQSPKMTITSSEKLPAIQCATDAASTFGFWIGVSIYGIYDYLEYVWKKIRSKKNNKTETKIPKTAKHQRYQSHRISKKERQVEERLDILEQAFANSYVRSLSRLNLPPGARSIQIVNRY